MVAENSAATVSSALKGSPGDLVSTIATLSAKWAADVASAKTRARDLHGAVLHERQSLQESLGAAARLWGVLRAPTPTGCHLEDSTKCQRDGAVALRNVTQTVTYLDFFDGIPDALEEARKDLGRIVADGATKFVAGNACAVYNVHAMLAAVERVRDVAVLEGLCPETGMPASANQSTIPLVDETRAELDGFLIRGVFGDILSVSQSNPRFLVSAVRIVLAEEERDAWRSKRLASLQLQCAASGALALPRRDYKRRFFDAVASQIEGMFRPIDASLAPSPVDEVTFSDRPSKPPTAEAVLEWLNERIADNDLVQRFVAPCLPASFGISAFYEAKLHHRMMTTLLSLLRKITDGTNARARQQDDMIKFLLWYSSYRQGLGSDYSGIDSYLDDRDRELLVSFMRSHVASSVGAQISFVLDADAMSSQGGSFAPLSPPGATHTDLSDRSLSPNIPEAVFGTINEIVSRSSALGVRAVQKAVAIGIADSLGMFQSKFGQTLSATAETPCSALHPTYVCSVANNMAGCMESAESLREALSSSLADEDRMDVIAALEKSVEGFRKIAILAVHDLTRGVERSLVSLTGRLFAPHTGTEVMLDIVGTLDDSFHSMRQRLLPLHFEQLASECLRGIVAHYVTPFLLLAANESRKGKGGGESGRKSSAGMEDRKWVRGRSQSTLRERLEMGGLRTRRQFEQTGAGAGLLELNAAAVVAQIDKDIENLTTFFQAKVELRQRKQFQTVLEPMHAIRALYKCPPTPVDLVEAYQLAKASVRNAMDALAPKCGPERRSMSVRVAEAVWTSRPDVNASVRDEAVLFARSAATGVASPSKWEVHKRTLSASSKFSVEGEDSAFLWSPSVSARRNVH